MADLTAKQAASTTSPSARAQQAFATAAGVDPDLAPQLTGQQATLATTTGVPLKTITAKAKADKTKALAKITAAELKAEAKLERAGVAKGKIDLEDKIAVDETLGSLVRMSELNEEIEEGLVGKAAGVVGGIAPGSGLEKFASKVTGIDLAEEAAQQQAFKADSKSIVLKLVAQLKGALSDKDVAFVEDQVPQLGNTKIASRKVLANIRDRAEAALTLKGVPFTHTVLAFEPGFQGGQQAEQLPGGLTDLGDGTFRTRNGQIVERE